MTPNAYVHLENATVRIDVKREKRLQVSLHHLLIRPAISNLKAAARKHD
jgi:hypothetical protein